METLLEAKRRAIVDALTATGGRMRLAAQRLGISRSNLYKKLREWDIQPAEYGCEGTITPAGIPIEEIAA
jgi:DNA-binding NtrC family response regulator